MEFMRKNYTGILACFGIAVPAWLLGKAFPIIGGPVLSILFGMLIALFWSDKGKAAAGIKWTSKIILQTAVVLLGFGLNLGVIFETGKQSLPIIVCTIGISLLLAWALHKALRVPSDAAILVGVGSSICGGSAIAATAPVIGADDNEVAQSISVIFFFNVLAAIFFPMLGSAIGFDTSAGDAFGIFAGTAINDTSSVTAAASTWDSMWNLLYFVIASVITTVCIQAGMDADVFAPLKDLSKFFIIMAMAAIGLNSNVVQLVKSGGRPLLLGGCCWIGITAVSLVMQHVMGIW